MDGWVDTITNRRWLAAGLALFIAWAIFWEWTWISAMYNLAKREQLKNIQYTFPKLIKRPWLDVLKWDEYVLYKIAFFFLMLEKSACFETMIRAPACLPYTTKAITLFFSTSYRSKYNLDGFSRKSISLTFYRTKCSRHQLVK